MNLGDRSCRRRPFLEAAEEVRQGTTQLGLDGGNGTGAGKGWELILEVGKIGCNLLAHQVGAGREGLAQLDEGWARVLQGSRQTLPRSSCCPSRREHSGDKREGDKSCHLIEETESVVPGKDAGKPEQTEDVLDAPHHGTRTFRTVPAQAAEPRDG
jgi:hypothetical protein